MENSGRETTGSSAYTEHHRWSEVKTAGVLGAMVVFWALSAAILGHSAGFTVSLLVMTVITVVHWRDKLTPSALAKVALYGVPLAVLVLYMS